MYLGKTGTAKIRRISAIILFRCTGKFAVSTFAFKRDVFSFCFLYYILFANETRKDRR